MFVSEEGACVGSYVSCGGNVCCIFVCSRSQCMPKILPLFVLCARSCTRAGRAFTSTASTSPARKTVRKSMGRPGSARGRCVCNSYVCDPTSGSVPIRTCAWPVGDLGV